MALHLGLLQVVLLLESGSRVLRGEELRRRPRVLLKLSRHYVPSHKVVVLGHHVGGLLGDVGDIELVGLDLVLVLESSSCCCSGLALALHVDVLLLLVAPAHVQVVHLSQLHLLVDLLLVHGVVVCGVRRVVGGDAEALAAGGSGVHHVLAALHACRVSVVVVRSSHILSQRRRLSLLLTLMVERLLRLQLELHLLLLLLLLLEVVVHSGRRLDLVND